MAVTEKLIGVAKRQGLRRGVIGSSRRWTAIWAAATMVGFIRKRMNKPVAVERLTLKPGETILVSDLGISVHDEKQAQKQEQKQAKERRRRH